jgi:alginate O-acetyltransferase complex protein AlgI
MATASLPVKRDTPALPPWQGWLPVVLLPAVAVLLMPAPWPRWAGMWLLVFALYFGFKWLTWRRTSAPDAPWQRHAAYLLLWPGMDAPAFLDASARRAVERPTAGEWVFAALKLLAGVTLVWFAVPLAPSGWDLLAGWIGMVGLVLVLHFGLGHLASCLWRSLGIEARPLMDWPIAARGVSDFWGRRWNTAFRDLAHRFFFAPLLRRAGPAGALAAGFLFSGLVHDLVISLPAGAGYGLPTLYFLLQGGAIFVERSRSGRALGLGRGWRGWLFTALVVLGPAGILFHPPFVRNVVLPFLEVLRG